MSRLHTISHPVAWVTIIESPSQRSPTQFITGLYAGRETLRRRHDTLYISKTMVNESDVAAPQTATVLTKILKGSVDGHRNRDGNKT